jgi:hypothetical protein
MVGSRAIRQETKEFLAVLPWRWSSHTLGSTSHAFVSQHAAQ